MSDAPEGLWALPAPEDEMPHVPSGLNDELPWKDTYWFGFRDDTADVTAAVHLTVSANRQPGLRATVSLRRGREQVQRTVLVVPERTADSVGCPLVTLKVLDGTWDTRKHLVLTIDTGEVSGTFELRGRHFGPNLALLCPGLIPSASSVQLAAHVEQGLAVTGHLDWAGDRIAFNGYGHRDRSWGYRKSDGMSLMGYVFAGLHLPDATIGFLSWQDPSATSADPLPIGVWIADDSGVRAAVDGWYRRQPDGRPDSCGFHLPDGSVIEVARLQPTAEVFYAYHEPEFDGPAIGTLCLDQHVKGESLRGPVQGLFNHGMPFMADVLRNARFCAASGPQE